MNLSHCGNLWWRSDVMVIRYRDDRGRRRDSSASPRKRPSAIRMRSVVKGPHPDLRAHGRTALILRGSFRVTPAIAP